MEHGDATGTAGYVEGMEKIYAEYDPEMANHILDQIGLVERDAQGYRLRLDRKRLSILVKLEDNVEPVEAAELIKEYWKALGIQVLLRMVPRTELCTGGFEVVCYYTELGGYWPSRLDKWLPSRLAWAVQYRDWFESDGEKGIEPTLVYKELDRLYKEAVTVSSLEEFNRKFVQVMDVSVRNCSSILTLYAPAIVTVKKNLRNVRTENVLLETSNIYARTYTWYWAEE